ncbi:beta/gamma crystallin-related protein [Aeromonas enteropelogenes]|uniref:beta/gamma crystallin-related protein n=1 Tax=Aeromonas enteropelogenes TaxID=29489 RepID=UPI003BA275BD
MNKLFTLFTLLTLAGMARADILINPNIVVANGGQGYGGGRIHVCTLTPFNSVYADAGRSEWLARQKVSRRCQQGQGNNSLFCEPAKASCITTTLDERLDESDDASTLLVFDGARQRGESLRIDRDIPDLARYGFANRISSFTVPDGWVVRFFEETDFRGGYYTRKGGEQEATDFNNRIKSVRILSR